MTINLDTFLAVTAAQSLLLSAAVLKREYTRPEAWLLVGLVSSVFFYTMFKPGIVGSADAHLNLILAPLLASETLPGTLIIAYTVNVLFEVRNRRIYWVLVVPLVEILIAWTSLAIFGSESATNVTTLLVRAGQFTLFLAGGYGIWLARQHFKVYEAQSADNQRFVGLLLVLPAVAVILLNVIWLLTEVGAPLLGGLPSVELTIILMISIFQIWLVTFLVVGSKIGHKPVLELAPVEESESGTDSDKINADFDHICRVLKDENLYLDPELSLAKLSRKVGMNRSWVSLVINAQESLSFSLLVNRMRIDHAKELLANAEMSVLEVAFASGFNSKSTFNRVFKDLTGETPRNWRMKQANG